MKLIDLVGSVDALVLKSSSHPSWPHKKWDVEKAVKVVASTAEYMALEKLRADVTPIIKDAYDTYELMNGERDDANPSEWDSGLDDTIENIIEPYIPYLSADWLGRKMVGTNLHEKDGINTFVLSLAREVYKQMTHGKKPGQVLVELGWDAEYMARNNMLEPKETAVSETAAIHETVKALFAVTGASFDPIEIYDELDNAMDSDDGLALGATGRLFGGGLDEWELSAHVAGFRAAKATYGKDAADKVVELMGLLAADPSALDAAPVTSAAVAPAETQTAPTAQPAATAPAPAPEVTADVPAPTKSRSRKAASPAAGALDPRVLKLVKEHGGTDDKAMAEKIGVSRSTLNNYIGGKSAFVATAQQQTTIREMIEAHVAGLNEALMVLDGLA